MTECYRHPGRETYISCTRCSRPICSDCMISAPVGFQCPECVRGYQQVQPNVVQSRGSGFWSSLPIVTRTIIGLCIAIYAGCWLSGNLTRVEYDFGMSPIYVADGQWWRLLTSTFLHANLMHILFNMYALLVLGSTLERVLGAARFAAIYFASGLGGSVAALWFAELNTLSVGASGAIFGLMTATIVVGRRLHIDTSQIAFWLVLNVVLGFLVPGIDWRAHLGGAALGAIAAQIVTLRRSANTKEWRWIGVTLLLVILVVAVLVRNGQILNQFGG